MVPICLPLRSHILHTYFTTLVKKLSLSSTTSSNTTSLNSRMPPPSVTAQTPRRAGRLLGEGLDYNAIIIIIIIIIIITIVIIMIIIITLTSADANLTAGAWQPCLKHISYSNNILVMTMAH